MTMTPSTATPDQHAAPGSPMPLTIVRDQSFQLAFEPRDFNGAWQMAGIAASIGLCNVANQQEAFIRIAAGRELGLTCFQSLRLVYVVKGRPSLDASLMLALCLNHPQCEYFDLVETTGQKAVFKCKRKGRDEVRLEWTIEQAAQAGLLAKGQDKPGSKVELGSWHTYPEAMLRARCIAALARIVFPDALNGIYAREELIGDDVVGPAVHVATAAQPPANVIDAVVEQQQPTPAAPASRPVVTAQPPQTAPVPTEPARDFAAEVAGIKQAIVDAKTDEEKSLARKKIKAFGAEPGGAPFVQELRSFYEATHPVPAPAAGAST